jgi:hypothetical protein
VYQVKKRSFIVWLLIALLFVIGVGALISGPMLFLARDGHLFTWSVDMLTGTPFPDFLIPGIILFLFVGVFPVFAAYGLLKLPGWRWPEAINTSGQYHWAWAASWAEGVILLLWIIVEWVMVGYISFLQPLVVIWGVALIVLTLLSSTRRYCLRNG